MKLTIKLIRKYYGYSLKEAAQILGVSDNTLRKYESDSTHIPNNLVQKILINYKWDYDKIFFGKESVFYEQNRTQTA